MPAEQTPNIGSLVIPYAAIILIFYFIVFRPKQTEQKERQKMLAAIKKNDQVVTSGGIHGTIINVKEKTVIMRIDDNAKIEVDKEAIVSITKS